jgi:hypothetical protein
MALNYNIKSFKHWPQMATNGPRYVATFVQRKKIVINSATTGAGEK